jgi:hypothetical protein
MDEHRFDTLTRSLASSISRRGGLRLLAAAGASLIALARGKGTAAAQDWYRTAGEPCWDSDQCLAADAPLVCADNGFAYDGPLHCCTYEGSRCYADEHCCGAAFCDASGRCSSAPSFPSSDVRNPGNIAGSPCQTTDQCQRPLTGAICEYTVSTGDNRCCWYEGSLCDSGAQCCGSRICAGGVCQFGSGGNGGSGGSIGGGSGVACTWQGCTCVWYRDPECRASCPLYDPCDPGLRCTGSSDDIGTCVPV